MGVVGGPVIYHGRCRGGPFNTRDMAHATTVYGVGYDPHTKKAIVGLQGPSATYPDAKFGWYHWNETTHEWDWDSERHPKAVHK